MYTEIKGIIFDKDGTLFDFAATWEVWAKSFLVRLSDGDLAKATQIGAVIGFDMQSESFARDSIVIAGTPGEVTAALHPHFDHMSRDALEAVLNEEAEQAPQKEAVPLAPLLASFRAQGFKLGVATNDAEQPARAHLDQAGVTGHFDFIAGYDSGFGGKPAPGQLLAFSEQTGLTPAQIVMVGDSTHDLLAGKAAGMGCVAVLTGLASAADLRPFADAILNDIGDLPHWLSKGDAPRLGGDA